MTDATPLIHLSAALADLVAKAAPSVVSVRSYRSQSTGFVWRPGLIVTPDEALSEDGEITVAVPGGDSVSAQLVGRDPATDVAVLRIDRPDLQALQLTATTPAVGALTIAVGSIDGTPVASLGVVSHAGGPWRSLRGGNIDARIELDLRLRRNAEGGIALDTSGAAYGMAVFGPRRRVLVIPAATIERVADKLASHGRIPRAYLGQNLPVRRPKWIPRFGPEPEVPSDVTYLAGVILLFDWRATILSFSNRRHERKRLLPSLCHSFVRPRPPDDLLRHVAIPDQPIQPLATRRADQNPLDLPHRRRLAGPRPFVNPPSGTEH